MTVKELLYKAVIRRALKDKYDVGINNSSCRYCGMQARIEEGILVQKHYRRCSTGQLERILAI